MNKMKPIRFYQILIVVSCIVLSWGLAKFALFTQHEFRELIKWGNRYDYEADWGQKVPAPDGEETEIEKESSSKDEKFKVSWIYNMNKLENKVSDSVGKALENKKGILTTIFVMAFIAFVVFRWIKKRKRKNKKRQLFTLRLMEEVNREKSAEIINVEESKEILSVHNEIRQEFIQWEKRLDKHKKRKSYETIQKWFQRIGKSPTIIPIYEKIRYGEKEYSVEDLEKVKLWVKKSE